MVHTPPPTPTPQSRRLLLTPTNNRSRPTEQVQTKQVQTKQVPNDLPDEAFNITFSCDFWVQDKKAKTGFSQVTATNCTLKWNRSNVGLDDLKAACAGVARCDLTRKSIEAFVNSSAQSNPGGWSCWITSSRVFPKTAARRVQLSNDNFASWITEVFLHRGREPGITYISPNPTKQKKRTKLVGPILT